MTQISKAGWLDFYALNQTTPATRNQRTGYATLLANTTYFVPIIGGIHDTRAHSIHWGWLAEIVITSISMETSNMLWEFNGISDYTQAAGAIWAAEADPPPLVVAGGASSSSMWHLTDNLAERGRCVVVVGATGGAIRGRPHQKSEV